jgi:serine/threonine-protein kinase RsbT
MSSDVRREVAIRTEEDVVTARGVGRDLAAQLGFGIVEATQIATAISELARNALLYAGGGLVVVQPATRPNDPPGIEIIVSDEGPGIADTSLAMQDGFTTSQGLGLGLPGTRRLMDDFELETEAGKGTTIRVHKWPRRR